MENIKDIKKVGINTENKTQQEMVQWFRNNYCLKHHNPRYCIFAVPNDSKDAKEQMRKVSTGLLAGVSDFIVLGKGITSFFEVKTLTGVQSEKQKDFEKQVTDLGFNYYI